MEKQLVLSKCWQGYIFLFIKDASYLLGRCAFSVAHIQTNVKTKRSRIYIVKKKLWYVYTNALLNNASCVKVESNYLSSMKSNTKKTKTNKQKTNKIVIANVSMYFPFFSFPHPLPRKSSRWMRNIVSVTVLIVLFIKWVFNRWVGGERKNVTPSLLTH